MYQAGVDCRERRRVRTVVVYDWQHGDSGVREGEDDCRREGNVCERVVNSEEGYDETCQEEKKGM